jgi:hypothetical protein
MKFEIFFIKRHNMIMTSARSINANPESIQKLDKTVFIWLDILGFADALEDEVKYIELSLLLEEFQSHFNENDFYESTAISDGIILEIKQSSSLGLDKIFKAIGKIQFDFILQNKHFIRGGIAVGNKFTEDKVNYISNGFARAVKLESSFTTWPIIGTDTRMITEMRNTFNIDNKDECFGLTRCFNKNGDFIYFIDFIENKTDYLDLLDKKIEEYSDPANKNPKKELIRDKYIWLLRYYLHKYEGSKIPESLKGIVL